eukprot:TRINITY_DN18244_c1_g1_i1.p1 TRINITY_DN18244_c1_g1~~TRINITY_DN18244_c1_g1_i1.p1  ORF type:complete len:262 (-),score=51.50 TRINITY_DN18244_c1_g1_i1:852-1637(-)
MADVSMSSCATQAKHDLPAEQQRFEEAPTTLMLANIPCRARCQEIRQAVDMFGFKGSYDFFYLPFRHGPAQKTAGATHYGYAFINFKSSGCSEAFLEALGEKSLWLRNKKLCASIAKVQGHANVTKALETRNPSGVPWFDSEPMAASEDDMCSATTTASYQDLAHEDARVSDLADSEVPPLRSTAQQERVLYPVEAEPMFVPVQVTILQGGSYDTGPAHPRMDSYGGGGGGVPMVLPVNEVYFQEDAYLATGGHEFKIYSL